MSKITVAFIFILALFYLSQSVSAQFTELVVTPSENTSGGRNQMQLLTGTGSTTDAGTEKKSIPPQYSAIINRLINRLDSLTIRLERINQKLSTKIDKVGQKGINVSKFKTDNGSLSQLTSTLNIQIASVRNSSAIVLSTSNPQIDYPALRKEIVGVLDSMARIKNSQKELIEALQIINSKITIVPTVVKGN